MKITERIKRSKNNLMNLSVEGSGMTLTVKAGVLTVRGEEYTLLEDEEFQVPQYDSHALLIGRIVKTKEGEVRLFVDEMTAGHLPFNFETQDDLTRLRKLFTLNVPAGTTDLKDLELFLYKRAPLEEEPQETPNAEG